MEEHVLAVANSYSQSYYLNPDFDQLPKKIKDEIQILCVLHTEEVGGILTLYFNEEGQFKIRTYANDFDPYYDEIGSHLKIKAYIHDKQDLFESLEQFYATFYLQ